MTNDGYFIPGTALANQPAVPASGVAIMNPFMVDCTVYITGVSITGVSVGTVGQTLVSTGMTTPAGGASLTLVVLANRMVSISYTGAAPTWVWIAQ